MICYLVRHGKDDDSVRGGWSDSPLTRDGITQVEKLSEKLKTVENLNISAIYTSDLRRAKETADILAAALKKPIIEMPEFRETNNGLLAGMNNKDADLRYPGLYWNASDWEQSYPGGESPAAFCGRIAAAWKAFKSIVQKDQNVMLVTHGGVINVIRCIENGIPYSNKTNPFPMRNAEIVAIEI